ncbi:MAG TPA: threonine/serine dehydratase [Bryobacteraceae bacterium]|jgi:threonine dehydratase
MSAPHRLSLERIAEASRLIDPVFRNSPQFESEPLSRRLGVHVILKVETMNPIRSFKGRGAEYFIAKLPSSVRRLACASAGNFGQGLAFSARKYGIGLDVFASVNANPLKLDAIRRFGADVHQSGHDFDAAKSAGRTHAAAHGILFVEDGKEPEISEGAGTIGLELSALPSALDAIFIPLGNGALIGGIARWLKHASPSTKIVGVCAAAAPSMEHSWTRKKVIETRTAQTIADGIGVRVPIPEAVDDTLTLVDQIIQVGDRAMVRAMCQLFNEAGILVEPSGASGLAALHLCASHFRGHRAAVILTGANLSASDRMLF